jgi:hypothetical protein
MKQILLIFVFLSIHYQILFSQTLTFNLTFGGTVYDDARGVVPTPDGGILFTGLTKNGTDPTGDTYLTRLNAAGAVVFQKKYGLTLEDGGNGLLATSDGGYLIIGHTAFTYGEECDGYLIKTDAKGNETWRSFVGSNLDDVTNNAIEMADGTYRMCGKSQDANHNFHVLLASIAADGRVIFTRQIPADKQEIAYQIKKDFDGNLLLCGFAFEGNQEQNLLLKCDNEGNLIWKKRWGNAPKQRLFDLSIANNGQTYVVGESVDAAGKLMAMQLAVLDTDGNLVRELSDAGLFGIGRLTACAFDEAGILVVAGTEAQVDLKQKPIVAWLDVDLKVLEKKEIIQQGDCRSRDLCLQNNAVIIVGSTEKALFVSKTIREEGNLKSTDVQQNTSLLFPNPMLDVSYLKTGMGYGTKTLEIISIEGKLIRQEVFNTDDIFIQRNGLVAGWYVLKVKSNDGHFLTDYLMID